MRDRANSGTTRGGKDRTRSGAATTHPPAGPLAPGTPPPRTAHRHHGDASPFCLAMPLLVRRGAPRGLPTEFRRPVTPATKLARKVAERL